MPGATPNGRATRRLSGLRHGLGQGTHRCWRGARGVSRERRKDVRSVIGKERVEVGERSACAEFEGSTSGVTPPLPGLASESRRRAHDGARREPGAPASSEAHSSSPSGCCSISCASSSNEGCTGWNPCTPGSNPSSPRPNPSGSRSSPRGSGFSRSLTRVVVPSYPGCAPFFYRVGRGGGGVAGGAHWGPAAAAKAFAAIRQDNVNNRVVGIEEIGTTRIRICRSESRALTALPHEDSLHAAAQVVAQSPPREARITSKPPARSHHVATWAVFSVALASRASWTWSTVRASCSGEGPAAASSLPSLE